MPVPPPGGLHPARRFGPAGSDVPGVRHATTVLAILALLLLPAAGCGRSDGAIPVEPRPGRPDDGLLGDPALQAVVDLQVARDASGLVERLSDPDPRVRARAAFALGSVQAPTAVPALLEALHDPSPRVRADAAFALGQVGGDDVAAALLEALEEEEELEVRRQLVGAIGKVGGPEAVDALALYRDPRLSADIALALSRAAAVRGVSTEPSVARAASGITHPDPDVRMASAYVIGRSPTPSIWFGFRRRARGALEDAYEKDDPAAMWLLQGLGRAGDRLSRDVLLQWARESPDWRARVNAIQAQAQRVPDPETIDVYLAALDDPSPHVRVVAAEALMEFPVAPPVAERMKAWVDANPEDWRTGGRLLAALGQLGETEFVLSHLEEIPLSELERWRLGVHALGFTAGEGVVRLLERLLESPHPEIAEAAMSSLVTRWRVDQIRPETHEVYWDILSEAAAEGEPRVVYPAASALASPEMAQRGGVELILDLYGRMGEDVGARPRIAVLEALGRSGDPAAVALLRRELRNPSPRVRETAGSALVDIVGGSVELPSQAEIEAERRAAATAAEATAAEDTAATASPSPRASAAALPEFLGERIDWARLAELGPHPLLHLETDLGEVVVRLDAEEAPWTVQTIATLAEAGEYDGVRFHRVVPNFVAQTGDITGSDGTGAPGFRIGSELTRIAYGRGVIGMASSGKDTETSQFFITHSPQPHLDGSYSAFGYVVEGMDVVDRITVGERVRRAWIEPGR